MPDSLSRTLARYVVSLDYESLPPEVVDKIKASLLHSLIISIVGAETSHGRAAIELAKEEEGKSDGAAILVGRPPGSNLAPGFGLCPAKGKHPWFYGFRLALGTGLLKDRFNPERHRARSFWGVADSDPAKVAAYTLCRLWRLLNPAMEIAT